MERPETMKQCQLCNLRTSSMAFLLRHLATVHSSRAGFFFSCGLNGCLRTFRNITTYKHHVYAMHSKNHTNLSTTSTSQVQSSNQQDRDSDSDSSQDGSHDNTAHVSHDDLSSGSLNEDQETGSYLISTIWKLLFHL